MKGQDLMTAAVGMRQQPSGPARTFLRRLVGAGLLRRSLFEEVEADRQATASAFLVVLLSSAASGVGAAGFGMRGAGVAVAWSLIALGGWVVWALLTWLIGTRLLPEPATRADPGELLRTLGFAAAPGLLRVAAVVPGTAPALFGVTSVWMLAAMVVAVRQALDYRSTARAVLVCLLSAGIAFVLALGIGLVLSRQVE